MDSRARKDTWGTARRIVAVAISLLLAVAFVPTSGFVAQPAQASADERFDGQAAVTLVGNGGNFSKWDEAAEETVYCDQTVLYMGPSDSSIYTVPTREDYTFIGWSDSSDASEASYPFDNESRCASYKAPESDVTLYAVWKATPYATLTLNANGGIFYVWDKDEGQTREEPITTQRVVQDEQGWIWKTPDRDEYRLAGWDTDKDASPESVVYGPDEWGAIPITASSDMTLYAIWKKREFTTLTLQCPGAHYTAYESIVENKTLESDANGTVVLQVELGVENEISVSPDAKYKLSMWSSTNGETYDAGYFTVCPEGPMTLTATAEEVETITFVLHANGGYFVDKWSDGTGQIVTAEQSSREFAKDQERYRIHDSESERGPLWNYDSEAHIKHKFVGFSKTETEPSATAEADYSFGEYGDISVLASDFADATEPVDLYATWQTIDCWNVTLDAGDGWFLRGSVDDAVHGAKNEIDYVEKGNQYRVEDMSWGKHVHIGWATEKGGPVVYEVSEDVVWDELPAIDIDKIGRASCRERV